MSDRIGPLAGVLVYTSADRFPAMLEFYRDMLGLEPRSQREHFVNFAWGDLRLTVTVHSELREANRDPLHLMLNFAVDDIDGVHGRLVARGVAFARPPQREHFGGYIATLADPDGNVVQLLQQP